MKSKKLISIILILAMLISAAIPALTIGEDGNAEAISAEEVLVELTEELEPEITDPEEPAADELKEEPLPEEEQKKESSMRKLDKATVLYAEKELKNEIGTLKESALVILKATEEKAAEVRYAANEDGSKTVKTAWVKIEDLKPTDEAELQEKELNLLNLL